MTFIPNPLFATEFEREPRTRLGMAAVAESVKGIAESLAPEVSGDYAGAFHVVEDARGTHLVNTDWKGHWVEWGTVNMPPQAVIRRAVQAAGLNLNEAGLNLNETSR